MNVILVRIAEELGLRNDIIGNTFDACRRALESLNLADKASDIPERTVAVLKTEAPGGLFWKDIPTNLSEIICGVTADIIKENRPDANPGWHISGDRCFFITNKGKVATQATSTADVIEGYLALEAMAKAHIHMGENFLKCFKQTKKADMIYEIFDHYVAALKCEVASRIVYAGGDADENIDLVEGLKLLENYYECISINKTFYEENTSFIRNIQKNVADMKSVSEKCSGVSKRQATDFAKMVLVAFAFIDNCLVLKRRPKIFATAKEE